MDHKDKKSVEKWQLIIQWICAGTWIAVVIVDIVCKQKLFLMITQSVAAFFFLLSAIILTKRYRRERHD